MAKSDKKPIEFEANMKRLEEIVARFDEGALSLDEMEAQFAEGMELLNACSDRLDQVELRITQLLREQKERWSDATMDANAGLDENDAE